MKLIRKNKKRDLLNLLPEGCYYSPYSEVGEEGVQSLLLYYRESDDKHLATWNVTYQSGWVFNWKEGEV